MKNYALSFIPLADFDSDDLINEFESFLVLHGIGSTYAADMNGKRFSICFSFDDDDEQKLGKVEPFVDRLPPGCNPSIDRIQ